MFTYPFNLDHVRKRGPRQQSWLLVDIGDCNLICSHVAFLLDFNYYWLRHLLFILDIKLMYFTVSIDNNLLIWIRILCCLFGTKSISKHAALIWAHGKYLIVFIFQYSSKRTLFWMSLFCCVLMFCFVLFLFLILSVSANSIPAILYEELDTSAGHFNWTGGPTWLYWKRNPILGISYLCLPRYNETAIGRPS